LNLRNPLIVEVTHRAADSRLAELNRLIERAATSRPTVLRTADRYAGPFLVCVLLVALIAGIVWWFINPERAPWIAAAILIVTCPCALALAAPSALLATLGGLARRGIIIDRSDTLEALARSDVVLFDKTGTLTTSTPGIELVDTSPGLSGADALALAAAIERSSLHPVARAFAEAAHAAASSVTAPGTADTPAAAPHPLAARAQVREVTNLPAGGLQARLDIGNAPWSARIVPDQAFIILQLQSSSQEHQPDEPTRVPSPEPDAHAGQHAAAPTLTLADTRTTDTVATPAAALHARFRLTETLRPGAAETLARLRADGVQCRIVSGDHADRVTHIARQLDLPPEAQRAGARPEDKLDLMREFQQQGRRVTMVGDGVNDAPVLSRADVSVSLASAAPLAQHHADILLLSERLDGLLAARDAARRALRIVHQNLIFSCLYNVLAIPLAAIGLVPPWLAGLGMAGSSLVVVLNALRAAR
ncbi:MAG: HAD-IC family P-type ATPase, partial [Lautropia mirabilis]